MSTDSTNPNEDLGGIGKLIHLDPVLVSALITVITSVAALFGVELAGGKAKLIAVVVLVVIVFAAQLWARRKTLAKRKVLAYLPDPVDRPNAIAAGPATVVASTSQQERRVLLAVSTPGPR